VGAVAGAPGNALGIAARRTGVVARRSHRRRHREPLARTESRNGSPPRAPSPRCARLARLLTGRGIGLTLSGGGARGLAHIGVVKALRQANIAIDAVGGTSLGAILGAGVAMEWTHDELVDRFRRAFVDTNPLNDYTLPLMSLVSGRKVTRLLRGEFGELQIEDLPLPFYCVSSNLTTGRLAVHRTGSLWRWLRASVAIPGVLPPIFHQGDVHVDGGAMNNLPVDVMREVGRGPIIGVDVGADRAFTADFDDVDVPGLWKAMAWFRSKKKRVNIFQILWRAGMVNSAAVPWHTASRPTCCCSHLWIDRHARLAGLSIARSRPAIATPAKSCGRCRREH
jgi:predicted acylesterase/phospholipase RssA